MAKAPTAKRYAQALFQLAKEHAKEEAWLEQLRRAQEMVEDIAVQTYLTWPRIRSEQKLDAVAQLLAGSDTMILNVVSLLSVRRNISLLPQVVSEYEALLNNSLGRVRAEVTSAVPLSDQQAVRLRSLLSEKLNKDVALEMREDQEIMGGVIIRVGDQVIDGSVRTRLLSLGRRLAQRSTV